MKFNLSEIMRKAWELFRKLEITFSEALRRSWAAAKARPINEARIAQAAVEAGITEQVNTWAGWKRLGYEVRHGSKCLFGCDLIYAAKGSGAIYKARFFGASQVQPISA